MPRCLTWFLVDIFGIPGFTRAFAETALPRVGLDLARFGLLFRFYELVPFRALLKLVAVILLLRRPEEEEEESKVNSKQVPISQYPSRQKGKESPVLKAHEPRSEN